MSIKVQLYVMSHDRKAYVLEALDSICAQALDDVEVIVSENSSNDEVADLIRTKFPSLKMIRRTPMLTMSQHWNAILSEITAPYFMMFHDDDILRPQALKLLTEALEQNQLAVAAAGNALVLRETVATNAAFNKALRANKVISSPLELGEQYFSASLGVQPFPGYLFRASACKDIRINNKDAGKHSDVTFLMKCLRRGKITWINAYTLNYRIHGSNDSVGVDILALTRLIRFFYRESKLNQCLYFAEEFKFKNYILWLTEQGLHKFRKAHPWRFKTVSFYLTKFALAHPFGILKIGFRKIARAL